MNADKALVIGYSHQICQDFVKVGQRGGQPFVVLADGCSGSPDTDTGARILVHTAADYLMHSSHKPVDPKRYHRYTIREAIQVANHELNLSTMSCDATLLTTFIEDNYFHTLIYGDGVLALHHRNLGLIVHEINFESDIPGHSFPDYPAYMVDAHRKSILDQKRSEINLRKICKTGSWTDGNWLSVSLEMDYEDSHSAFFAAVKDFNWVAIFSDGIQTFNRPVPGNILGQREPVPTVEVIQRLCDFKNMHGQFVQRRLSRFLKDTAKEGWKHEDDVSVGVINLDA